MNKQSINTIVKEMINRQQQLLLSIGRRIVPTLTTEDVLQPFDYPQLESHPEFRYEEGFLAGLQSIQMALQSIED